MDRSKLNWLQRSLIKGMGVDKFVDDYNKNQRSELKFENPNSPQDFQAEEYKTWFYGTPERLEEFYKKNIYYSRYQPNHFWRAVNTNMVRVHSPFAATISNAFGALLFSNSPEIKVDSNKVTVTRKMQNRLNDILDVNDILSLLQEAAQYQSYSGMVGLKLNIEQTITDVPLITLYPKERMNIHKKYNQVIYIDFIDYFNDGDHKLISRYGRGYITYKLLDKNGKRVPIDTLEETAGLEDVAFYKDERLIPIVFAEVVQNKSGDRSDYDGLIPLFHALDETYSTMMNYIRKTKPNVKITEDLAIKDPITNKPLPRSDFDNNIIVLDSVPNQTGNETKIERDITDPVIAGFEASIDKIREEILMKVSLSPGTLGLSIGGARESSEALEVRERSSARIRQEKLAIWQEKLASFLSAALILDLLVQETDFRDGVDVGDIPEFQVLINFSEYKTMGLENKVDLYLKQYEKGLIPIDFALARIYGDSYSKSEILSLSIRTKTENNIPLTQEEEEFRAKEAEAKSRRTKNTIENFM